MFFNWFQQKDTPFSWKKTILTLLVSAIVAMCLVFLITTQHPMRVGFELLTNPTMILWNFLPALLAVFLVYCITGRLLFSSLLLQVVWILFAVSDKIKVSMRQEPLLPTDLTLVKDCHCYIGFQLHPQRKTASTCTCPFDRHCLRGAGSAGTEQSGL